MEHPMKKVTILLPLLLILSLLQGCHGSGSAATASALRLVNGDVGALDMYWFGSSTSTPIASGVPYSTASSGVGVSAGNSAIGIVSAGGAAPTGTTYSFSGGYSYTMVAVPSYDPITGQKTLLLKQLVDNQITPASGGGLLGVEDYSGFGGLDVYVVTGNVTTIPSGTTPLTNGIYSPVIMVPAAATSTSYHIQVTGAGAGPNNDVRLDIPSATIGNQQIMTLALTPTTGGVLVDGLLILQQGLTPLTGQPIVTPYKNGSARIRIAASGSASAATATINGTTSITGSPFSTYVPVPLFANIASLVGASPQSGVPTAAPQALTLAVSGGDASCNTTIPTAATPGQDLTLMIVAGATPECYLINDNNTLASAGYAKLRLVNGTNGSGSITLSYDSGVYSQSASFGTAASAVDAPIPNGTPYALSVSPPWTGSTSWGSAPPTLQQYGVYSVFLLGNTTTAASAVLSADHTYLNH
jgi:hypothetical protein